MPIWRYDSVLCRCNIATCLPDSAAVIQCNPGGGGNKLPRVLLEITGRQLASNSLQNMFMCVHAVVCVYTQPGALHSSQTLRGFSMRLKAHWVLALCSAFTPSWCRYANSATRFCVPRPKTMVLQQLK